jgi:hypothetical protein
MASLQVVKNFEVQKNILDYLHSNITVLFVDDIF